MRERKELKIRQHHPKDIKPKLGHVVLIHENLPRGTWKFGKIVKLIVSNDGEVRSAEVLTKNRNILTRPINKLYPLETTSDVMVPDTKKSQKIEEKKSRPIRKAAIEARKKFAQWQLIAL